MRRESPWCGCVVGLTHGAPPTAPQQPRQVSGAEAALGPPAAHASRIQTYTRPHIRPNCCPSILLYPPERVAAEAERLLQSSVGAGGLDPAAWRRFPQRLGLLAERNVRRQEAKELARWGQATGDPCGGGTPDGRQHSLGGWDLRVVRAIQSGRAGGSGEPFCSFEISAWLRATLHAHLISAQV